MDTKIQKYARWNETAAKILMCFSVSNWIAKWFFDWVLFYSLYLFENLDVSKYKSFADVLEKFPKEQLGGVNLCDIAMQADTGSSWIGIANLAKLSWTSRLVGFLADGVSVGILIIGFYLFIKLMKQLKTGSLFSIDVIELLNKIAKVIFWFALYTPINRTIVSLLVAFSHPVGQRFWIATFNFNDILTLAASWFFVILTSVMRESQQLKEEHDTTV